MTHKSLLRAVMKRQMQRRARLGLLFFFIIMPAAKGQIISDKPPQPLMDVGVEERLGETIPLDLLFVNSRGDTVTLGQYFKQGKPVLLSMVYYECPMLCTLVLNGLTNALQQIPWTPGREFQMVTVSIDPEETPDLAAQKKYRYLRSLRKPGIPEEGWVFLVGDSSQSKKLADALGFRYKYDAKQDNYAHPAVAFLLTENGKISRYLYGIEFKERDLRLALLEAGEGKIGNTLDKIILFCYHYDPDSQSYTLFATNLMRLGGVLTVIVLGILLGILWKKDKFK